MSESFSYTIDSDKLRADIKTLVERLGQATSQTVLSKGLTEGAFYLARWSQRFRLSGPRPQFLGVKTGRLRSSISVFNAIGDKGKTVVRIGTNVSYARIHEFGGFTGRNHRIRIPARPFLSPSIDQPENKQLLLDVLTENINEALA